MNYAINAETLAQAMNDFELRADLPALVETNRGTHRSDCAHVGWIAERYTSLRAEAMALKYGPVGDRDSSDPFERAQASAPEGWHVEGQIIDGIMQATTKAGDHLFGRGVDDLVRKMRAVGPR